MEKRRPTYDLAAIKRAIGTSETLAITISALRDATALGFDRRDIVETIWSTQQSMFFKSMTTLSDHRVWQDVYRVPSRELVLYVKFQADWSNRIQSGVFQGEMRMAGGARALPETMISPETGERLTRGVRPFDVVYKGETVTVDLPGFYPEGAGDGVVVGDDMQVVDEAMRALRERIDGIPSPATIRRVRKKLKLTQRQAGRLLKVGESAFDKYERGLIEPSGPASQLIRVLDRHPELVAELD